MNSLIYKNKSKLKLKSNLEDYQNTYSSFKIEDYKSELSYFDNNKINAAFCACDRHLSTSRREKLALIWESDSGETQKFTFFELAQISNRFANLLKLYGVKKGDRVFLFLPRIPELYIAFLAILKNGAIAGTMFSAFGPQAIEDRLSDSEAKIVITSKELEPRILEVKKNLPKLEKIIVIDKEASSDFEINYQEEIKNQSTEFEIEKCDPDDFAFMLYTSGTTGKPKGVVHRHLAILHQHLTAKWVLDLHDEDIYWCTADPGWVTGIAYGILGIWSVGATSIVHEGRFDPDKWYSIIDKYQVSVWYTAPTAVRMLMAQKEKIKNYKLDSLRYLASVGEPLNPEAVVWSNKVFGMPFHDNWWQTETGGILIANYPTLPVKSGSMGKPFPGISASIVDDDGKELPEGKEGNLVIKPGWPSMMRTIWGNEQKYKSYFTPPSLAEKYKETEDEKLLMDSKTAPWYYSGDHAYRDSDGYFWFIGRADDVIKTSGERVGPFEVESALVEHPDVIEAGVIGKPDQVRGEIIKAFVKLKPGVEGSEKLKEEISQFIKKHLAGHAYPREIEFVDSLPKTRSGKIMRRLLKAKELGQPLGDTSTLEEY